MRPLVIGLFALLLSSGGLAQECNVTVLASFYDQPTKDEIETLKTQDLEIKIDGQKLPVQNASRDFENRLLILLETEGSARNEKLSDLATRDQAGKAGARRQARGFRSLCRKSHLYQRLFRRTGDAHSGHQ